VGAVLVVTFAFAPAAAQGPAQAAWPQFQGTPAHTGVAQGPPPPYRKAWELALDAGRGDVALGPVVSGDTGVVVTPVSVVAFEVATGTQRWSIERDGDPSMPAIVDVGGTPAVVYPDGDDAEAASLAAVALEDGSPMWEASLEAEPTSGVTVDDDGRVFVVDADARVYAVETADGAVSWTQQLSGAVVTPPAVAGGGVFVVAVASDDVRSLRIAGLDAETGDALWPAVEPDAASPYGSAASVDADDLIVALQDGVVHALSIRDGSTSWSARISAFVSPVSAPAVDDGAVFAADRSGGLHRVGPAGRDWVFAFNEGILQQSPVVLGEVVVVGFQDGGVGAVDVDSGHMTFRTDATGVPVTGMGPVGDILLVAHGGSGVPRVVGLATDPAGELVDEASPTDADAAEIVSSFAIAFAVVALLTLTAGRFARSRYQIRDPSREVAGDGSEESG
jgi:outer membrane protein assembly factor BamB